MTTFNTSLDALVDLLADSDTLRDYAVAHWQNAFTVRREDRNHIPIDPADLPLILVMRPQVTKTLVVGGRDTNHTLKLYVLFKQLDSVTAQTESVEIEEMIDDLLLATEPDTLGMKMLDPTGSRTDDAASPPIYSIIMDVEVWHRR
jgi:hypothetical protein